ncbi:MAG: hypothetical protein EOP56_14040 [Sphingobacteriales bacterium]|nr:MAG: hypothetical protein EOP56_14040 [Sphingobacteriales bacterium]
MRRDEQKKDRQDQDLPGYPHYPAREDITNPDNNNGEVSFNENTIELPEVSDIPGQERINPAPGGMMADTTISSDDEEGIVNGRDIFAGDDDEVKIVMGTEADVTAEDLRLLGGRDEDMDVSDDELMGNMQGLDDTDFDGEKLNEGSGTLASTGEDLDLPTAEGSDLNEALGQGDEENDYFSLGSDDNDNLNEGTP